MENKSLAVEEYLPIMLSAAGAIGILPFAIIRLVSGDILIAALDIVLVGSLTCLAAYSYRTRRIRLASIVLALLCVSGMIATIYIRGPAQAFWIYPVLIAVFFLIKRREALLLDSAALIAVLPALAGNIEPMALTSIVITSMMTCTFAFAFATVTRSQRDALLQLARKDPLTGAGNRRALQEKLEEVIATSVRRQSPASILMLDLDHFKSVNDRFGHAAGDRILVRITELIDLRIRVTDSIYRIGGEEFVVVLDDQCRKRAMRLAEQLRTIVEANELAPSRSVTISIGVAELRGDESADDWLRRADSALYAAKDAGRNTTEIAA